MKSSTDAAADIRKRAEERLTQLPPVDDHLSPEAARHLIQELRLRQAELELQQEDLQRRHQELQAAYRQLQQEYAAAQHTPVAPSGGHEIPAGLLSVLDEGLGVVNDGLEIIWLNDPAAALLGRPREELLGRRLPEVIPPEQRAGWQEHVGQVLQGNTPHTWEVLIQHPSGGHRYEVRAYPHHQGVALRWRDITERKRMEETLVLQGKILESLAEGVVLTDRRGLILYTNPAFDAMFGYRRRELLKQPSHVLNHYPPEENRRHLKEILEEINASGGWQGELRGRRRDGSPFYSRVRISTFTSEGTTYYVSLQSDITAEKEAKQELQRLASFPELHPHPILEVDESGQVVYANPAAREAATQLELPCGVNGFVPADLGERFRQARESSNRQQMFDLEAAAETYTVFLSFPHDLPTARLYALPITDRLQAEAALREGEARLAGIFAAAPLGIGLVQNRILKEVNHRLCDMLGYEPGELLGQSARILYPTEEEFEQVGQEKYRQVEAAGVGAVVTRWRRKDGAILDIYLSSSPLRPGDLRGGMIFTAMDITELRRAREALRESEERYRSLFQNSHAVMLLLDPETGAIADANPAACAYYGYTREELLSLRITDLNTMPRRKVFQAMHRLRNTIQGQFQFRHRLASGEIRDVEVFSGPLSIRGKTYLFSIIHDITSRKETEAALKQAQAELEQRVTERTAALRLANVQLLREMDERALAEKALRRNEATLDGLNRIFREALTCRSRHELGQVCLEVARQLTASPWGFLSELTEEGTWRLLAHGPDGDPESTPRLAPFRGGEHVVMANTPAELPDSFCDPEGRACFSAFLGVPLFSGDRLVGFVAVADRPGGYTQSELGTLETLGPALVEALRHQQAEMEIKESERKLRFLADQLLTAQEHERKRLAAELHDELGHALLILKLSLSSVAGELLPGQESIRAEIHNKLDFLNEVINKVRRLYRALSPSELEYLGLTQALLSMIDEMAAHQPQVSWLVDLPDLDRLFSPPVQTIIYRVIQEALTNVGKHAEPYQVNIVARREGSRVRFAVEDDGRGFDPRTVSAGEAHRGLGLATMEERVHMAGGTLEIQSAAGRGTLITFTIPVSPEKP
jgi:PAS domain S-box-containing protein